MDYVFFLCVFVVILVWIKSKGKFLGMVKGLLYYFLCCGINIYYTMEENFSFLGWERFWVVWCIFVFIFLIDFEIINFFFIWIFFDIIVFYLKFNLNFKII